MASIVIRPDVFHELDEIEIWYEQQQAGLANQFRDAFSKTLDRIQHQPNTFPTTSPGIHRIEMKGFPYAVFYHPHDNEVVVLHVMHKRRNPQRWPIIKTSDT